MWKITKSEKLVRCSYSPHCRLLKKENLTSQTKSIACERYPKNLENRVHLEKTKIIN